MGFWGFGVGPVLGLGQFWLGQFWVRPVLGWASFYQPVMGRPVMSGPVLGCNRFIYLRMKYRSSIILYSSIGNSYIYLFCSGTIILQNKTTTIIAFTNDQISLFILTPMIHILMDRITYFTIYYNLI